MGLMAKALKNEPTDNTNVLPAMKSGGVLLDDREDAASIKKTVQAAQIPPLAPPPAANALDGRVSLENPLSPSAKEHVKAVDAEFGRLNAPQSQQELHEGNFLMKMREVIAQILATLTLISDKDRSQTEQMKREYRQSSQKAADLQRTLGNAGLWVSAIGFTVLLSQFVFKNPDDRLVMKFLSEQCPNIGGMFTSRYQANQKEADSLSQLLLAEYNAKTSKSQSDSSSKQEIINLLDKALESMKRAASAA